MAETELHERLTWVLLRFEGGRIDPLEFRWGVRELRVRSVNARWVDRATRPHKHFFSVTLGSDEVVVLSWKEGEALWYVESLLAV